MLVSVARVCGLFLGCFSVSRRVLSDAFGLVRVLSAMLACGCVGALRPCSSVGGFCPSLVWLGRLWGVTRLCWCLFWHLLYVVAFGPLCGWLLLCAFGGLVGRLAPACGGVLRSCCVALYEVCLTFVNVVLGSCVSRRSGFMCIRRCCSHMGVVVVLGRVWECVWNVDNLLSQCGTLRQWKDTVTRL